MHTITCPQCKAVMQSANPKAAMEAHNAQFHGASPAQKPASVPASIPAPVASPAPQPIREAMPIRHHFGFVHPLEKAILENFAPAIAEKIISAVIARGGFRV